MTKKFIPFIPFDRIKPFVELEKVYDIIAIKIEENEKEFQRLSQEFFDERLPIQEFKNEILKNKQELETLKEILSEIEKLKVR